MINAEILKNNPNFWIDLNNERYYLVLSNDMDSFLSCSLLEILFDLKIGGFYHFDKGLFLNEDVRRDKEAIFIDACVLRGKAIDNHYSRLIYENDDLFSMNKGVTTYNKKYNSNTLSIITALFKESYPDILNLTEDRLFTLLCVDKAYKGIFNKSGKYADINYFWWDKLGIQEFKYFMDKYNDINYYIDFSKENCLDLNIDIDQDGTLFSPNYKDSNICDNKFELVQKVKNCYMKEWEFKKLLDSRPDEIFSAASTFSGEYSVSLLSKE